MASPQQSKRIGLKGENTFVQGVQQYLKRRVERRRLQGALDQGDVAGWDGVCVEVKAGRQWNIPDWLRQLEKETQNAGADIGFIAVLMHGRPNFEQMVAIMPMPEFMELMVDAGWADHLPGQGPVAEIAEQGDTHG